MANFLQIHFVINALISIFAANHITYMTKVMNFSDSANDSLQNSASANEKGIVSIFNYNGAKVSFNKEDGTIMVNATEMAKPFGRKPSKWLELPSAKEFISALTEVRKSDNALIQTDRGGINGGGCTWMHEDVALEFARWLSPTFAIWCNDRIKELLTKGITATEDTIDKILSNPDFGIKLLTQLKEERAARLEAEAKIKADAPKVEFYDAVTDSKDAIDMRVVATTLNMGVGRNKIFDILRKENILDRKNIPYQRYIDNGYFRTVETSYSKPDGTQCINIKTVVFQKGLDFIRKIVENNIRKR